MHFSRRTRRETDGDVFPAYFFSGKRQSFRRTKFSTCRRCTLLQSASARQRCKFHARSGKREAAWPAAKTRLLRKTDVAPGIKKKLFRTDKVKYAQKLIPSELFMYMRQYTISRTLVRLDGMSHTLVNYMHTNAGFGVDPFVNGPALSPHFNPKRSRCALCGLWPAWLDNDLIGS